MTTLSSIRGSEPGWAVCEVATKTAGMKRPMTARTSSVESRPAILASKVWMPWRRPPTTMARPITSSRLPTIEPMIDARTMSSWPAASAKKAMISSATLPNVAFSTAPFCGPTMVPRRSVEMPIT